MHSGFRTCVLGFLVALCPLTGFADLVVLQYHHIADDTPYSTSTKVSLFKAQLDLIARLGLKVVPLRKATLEALAGKTSSDNQVAITFDDSLRSIYTTALPILEKRHYPFTVFINTDAIDKHYQGYMDWSQVKALARSPLVSIGNHSADHGHLIRAPGESLQDWQQRVIGSISKGERRIAAETGRTPRLFAYPYGEYSPTLQSIIARRHWLAYGQQSGVIGPDSSPTALPRFPAANAFGKIAELKTKLLARNFPIPATARPSPLINRNPPVLSFPLPSGWKLGQLHCYASDQGAIPVRAEAGNRISTRAPRPFGTRRFRYDCTYPAGKQQRYYWFSQPWINPSSAPD